MTATILATLAAILISTGCAHRAARIAPATAQCGTDTECMELCQRQGGTNCHLPYEVAK